MNIIAWDEIYGERSRQYLRAFLDSVTDSYAILQMKGVDETVGLRYHNYTWNYETKGATSDAPEFDHYDVVYAGRMRSGLDLGVLEDIFIKFNGPRRTDAHGNPIGLYALPDDYCGHSVSVSDIIALKRGDVVTFHYVDSAGYREVKSFLPENYLKNAEMAMEDDYGMIDGIINNGSKDEERHSVLEKLKTAEPAQSMAKPAKVREEQCLE